MSEKFSVTTYYSTEEAADTEFLETEITAGKTTLQTNQHAGCNILQQHPKVSIADIEVVKQKLTILWVGSRKEEKPTV